MVEEGGKRYLNPQVALPQGPGTVTDIVVLNGGKSDLTGVNTITGGGGSHAQAGMVGTLIVKWGGGKPDDGGRLLWFLDTPVTVRVAWAENTDHISVLEHRAPAGDSPPLHVHHTEDEVFCVLEGTLRLHVAGQDRRPRTDPPGAQRPPSHLPSGVPGGCPLAHRHHPARLRELRAHHGTTSSPPRAPTSLRPPQRRTPRRPWRRPRFGSAPRSWTRPRGKLSSCSVAAAVTLRGCPSVLSAGPSTHCPEPPAPYAPGAPGTGSTSPSLVASATELISATFLAYSSGV